MKSVFTQKELCYFFILSVNIIILKGAHFSMSQELKKRARVLLLLEIIFVGSTMLVDKNKAKQNNVLILKKNYLKLSL